MDAMKERHLVTYQSHQYIYVTAADEDAAELRVARLLASDGDVLDFTIGPVLVYGDREYLVYFRVKKHMYVSAYNAKDARSRVRSELMHCDCVIAFWLGVEWANEAEL